MSQHNPLSESQYPADEPDFSLSVDHLDHYAGRFIELGNTHYEQYLLQARPQDLDAAIQHYQRALSLDPKLAQGHLRLAAAQLEKGEIDLPTAIRHCKTSQELDPANGESFLYLGYFLRREGALDEAIEAFKTAISLAPLRMPKARIAYGSTLIQKALQDQHPGQKILITLQGLLAFGLGCTCLPLDPPSIRVFQNALSSDALLHGVPTLGKTLTTLGMAPLAARLYMAACRRTPGDPRFFHLLGDLYFNQNQPGQALSCYEHALSLDPDNITLHKQLGKLYLYFDDTEHAIRSLEKLVLRGEDDFETFYQLAQLYTDGGELMRALYYFKECARLFSHNPYVHSNMAYVLFKMEDYDGAIHEYQAAVNYGTDPEWTSTVAQTLGTLLYKIRQDIEAAIPVFEMACQLNPHNLDAQSTLVDLYYDQGNLETALALYRNLMRHQPDSAESYTYYGYLLWQMNRNDEAITAYERAIELSGDNAIAYNNLGVIYLDEAGRPEEAKQLFEKAVTLNDGYTMACFNLARSLEALNQVQAAAETYSRALTLNTISPELTEDEITTRLDGLFRA